MSEAPVSGRVITKAFAWFFAALSMVALLSPSGASQNEWFHMATIACSHGERAPYCRDVGNYPEYGYSAVVNFDASGCDAHPRVPLVCPTDRDNETRWPINAGEYPGVFHYAFGFLVTPSLDANTLVMRLANAFVIAALTSLLFALLPSRHRLVLILMFLVSIGPGGYFLFASINPSSWTLIGGVLGWLALHASFDENGSDTKRRSALFALSMVVGAMAVVSRWEAIPYVTVSYVLVLCVVIWSRFPRYQKEAVFAIVVLPVAVWTMILKLAPSLQVFGIWKSAPGERGLFARWLFAAVPGESDEYAFLSDSVLRGLPSAIRAVGTVPVMQAVRIPEIGSVVAVAVLGYALIRARKAGSLLQVVGPLILLGFASFAISTKTSITSDDDFFSVERTNVHPLIVISVGWWFLFGPNELFHKTKNLIRPVLIVAVASFTLAMFAIVERFVDHQTDGLRYLPEGPDQWWWLWLPFGPNIAIILSPVALWFFYQTLIGLVSAQSDFSQS